MPPSNIPTLARLLAAALPLTLVCFTGCDRASQASPPPGQRPSTQPAAAIVVALAPVKVEPVQRAIDVTGSLFGDEHANIAAKVPGRITAIYNDVGDVIPSGQPLAQIDPTDYQLTVTQRRMALEETLAKLGLHDLPSADFDVAKVPTVERARLQAANAEAKLGRANQLYKQNPPLISEQDYADIQTAFQVSKSDYDVAMLTARSLLAEANSRRSDLDLANQRLADATVRVPARGTVGVAPPQQTIAATQPTASHYAVAERLVSVGEYVQEGATLFRLVASDPIKYRAQVPERFAADVRVGQEARIKVEAYPDQPFPGRIARISPQIDPLNRTFMVEVLIPNPDGKLQAGSFAKGQLMTHTDPAVPFVPEKAVVTFAGVHKVFAVDAAGKAVEYRILPGLKRDDHVEVRKGLPDTVKQVVTTNTTKLATGTPVTLQPEASAKTD